MEFVLVGQPNCGKSTVFNDVVGYKSVASNFPGATVGFTKSTLSLKGEKIDVVDLPGTYSLQTSDDAELAALSYLMNLSDDSVIVNVVDASVLSRSLELTIQLAELKKPMVVALNMMDEAEKKGIIVDHKMLSEFLGVPVVKTVGRKGKGVMELFSKAFYAGKEKKIPGTIKSSAVVEDLYIKLIEFLKSRSVPEKWSYRYQAIKITEKDLIINDYLKQFLEKKDFEEIDKILKDFEAECKRESGFVVSSSRHDMAFLIFEKVATVKIRNHPRTDIRKLLDNVLMHPFWGYVSLTFIVALLFIALFNGAALLESVMEYADPGNIIKNINASGVLRVLIDSVYEGLWGGIVIAVCYLLPFFFFMSFLEDSGYLPRMAFLLDSLMHNLGLHGLSVIPMILGYGCSVPAILATRILKSKRDRLITAVLTTLVPCSARMIVILGIVGALFSIKAAVFIYILNIVIIAILGIFMSKAMPEVSPGMILEIPKYHMPGIKAVASKVWFRMKEFVYIALPLLVLGAVLLKLIDYFNLKDSVNAFLSPFVSGVLGLPAAVGLVLLVGILRKEDALILLASSAFGLKDVAQVFASGAMTEVQLFVFTVFVTFYVPCVATIAVLVKEFSAKKAALISLLTFGVAVLISLAFRFLYPLFF